MNKYVNVEDVFRTIDLVISDDSIKHTGKAIRKRLKELPTEDVEKVVRCKDCKHSRICVDNGGVIMCILDSEKDEETDIDYGFLSFHSENHYCSFGKRKEGAEE